MTVSARVVCDSLSPDGERLTTVEVNFWRFILPEINTHRVFSRSYQSSRAVPVQKMIDQVRNNPAIPVHWGKNQAGMVAESELDTQTAIYALTYWKQAAIYAAAQADMLHAKKVHKQVVNRLLEPFMWTKGIITADQKGWDSFFNLRCHKDAQPEIQALAYKIRDAMEKSVPNNLKYGEYHLPYVVNMFSNREEAKEAGKYLSIEQAIKISVSCCAQVSYRNLDDSLEKAEKIYKMLNLPEDGVYSEDPSHFSPAEHVAKCVRHTPEIFGLSGNFNCSQFEQYRKVLEQGKEWGFIND